MDYLYVRRMRLELTRRNRHYPLKVACLPIPPPAREKVPRYDYILEIKSPAILSNSEAFWKRAEDGTRTRDPNLGKVMLYQLSYFRIVCFSFASAKVVQIFILPNISGEKFNYGCKFYYRLYRRHIV